MKEKIVKIIADQCGTGLVVNCVDCGFDAGCGTDWKVKLWPVSSQILSLIREDIEKVENELIFIKTVPSMGDDLLKWHYDKGFKDCRQAILKILT